MLENKGIFLNFRNNFVFHKKKGSVDSFSKIKQFSRKVPQFFSYPIVANVVIDNHKY